MKKLLLLLLFVPIFSFGQLSQNKISKIKEKTTYSSFGIANGASVYLGIFETKNRAFDKSNIGSHIKKNLMECGLKPIEKLENADYRIDANYVTDAIAKKQILGLWLNMTDAAGNTVLSWQFERKFSGMILHPEEIGEFLKIILKDNLTDSSIEQNKMANINKSEQKQEENKEKQIHTR